MEHTIKSFSTERTIVYSDIHFQASLKDSDGKLVEADACHSPSALSVAFQIHKDFGADRVINIGDLYESALCSRWTKKINRSGQVMSADGQFCFSAWKDSVKLGKIYWEYMAKLSPNAELVQIEGNHEYRPEHEIRSNPQLEALEGVRIRTLPFWKELKIKYHPYNAIGAPAWHEVGRFFVMHGNSNKPAKMQSENHNVVYGDTHRFICYNKDATNRETEIGKYTQRAYSIGCLCKLDPEYSTKGGRANGWVNGFAYIYVLPNGMTQVEWVEIVNENTVINFNGKTYYAKPLREVDESLIHLELPEQ